MGSGGGEVELKNILSEVLENSEKIVQKLRINAAFNFVDFFEHPFKLE